MINWRSKRPHIDLLGTTLSIPDHFLPRVNREDIYIDFVKGQQVYAKSQSCQAKCKSHVGLGSGNMGSKGKAGFMPAITTPAGGESTEMGQLYSTTM